MFNIQTNRHFNENQNALNNYLLLANKPCKGSASDVFLEADDAYCSSADATSSALADLDHGYVTELNGISQPFCTCNTSSFLHPPPPLMDWGWKDLLFHRERFCQTPCQGSHLPPSENIFIGCFYFSLHSHTVHWNRKVLYSPSLEVHFCF